MYEKKIYHWKDLQKKNALKMKMEKEVMWKVTKENWLKRNSNNLFFFKLDFPYSMYFAIFNSDPLPYSVYLQFSNGGGIGILYSLQMFLNLVMVRVIFGLL